jgi:hypothetical protein
VFDVDSGLKMIDLTDGTIIKDVGKVHAGNSDGYQAILVAKGGEHLFTSESASELKQWCVRGRALVQDFF